MPQDTRQSWRIFKVRCTPLLAGLCGWQWLPVVCDQAGVVAVVIRQLGCFAVCVCVRVRVCFASLLMIGKSARTRTSSQQAATGTSRRLLGSGLVPSQQ